MADDESNKKNLIKQIIIEGERKRLRLPTWLLYHTVAAI
jgi:hypothetical protein